MMKWISKWVFIPVLFLTMNVHGQYDLVVEMTNIKAMQGQLYVSIYEDEATWLNTDAAFRKSLVAVEGETCRTVFSHLPAGEYAVAIFQDQNNNGLLDVTEMQIPKEAFGFSNNPKGIRGPATFQQAKFPFTCTDTVKIELVNNLFTPNKEKNEKPK